MNARPMFISFEGGEGSGKSTQIKKLSALLNSRGIDHVLTREPGGCQSALDIRKLLVEGDPDRWDGLSELFLYSAARHEHLRRVVRPALREGKWVLCDRFADSTTVYQSVARGVAQDVVEYMNMMVVGGTWPDITLLLDIDPEKGLNRTAQRQENTTETRFEQEKIEFHQNLRKGYRELAEHHSARFRMIDADQTPEDVFEDIQTALEDLWLKGIAAE